jgi:hypothetical protein
MFTLPYDGWDAEPRGKDVDRGRGAVGRDTFRERGREEREGKEAVLLWDHVEMDFRHGHFKEGARRRHHFHHLST